MVRRKFAIFYEPKANKLTSWAHCGKCSQCFSHIPQTLLFLKCISQCLHFCAGGLIFAKPRKTALNRIMNKKTEMQGN